ERIVHLDAACAPGPQVGHGFRETEEGRHREIHLARIEYMLWRRGRSHMRADKRHAEAVAMVLIIQAIDAKIGAEQQGTKFFRSPGEAVVRHRKREALPI